MFTCWDWLEEGCPDLHFFSPTIVTHWTSLESQWLFHQAGLWCSDARSRRLTLAVKKISTRRQHFFMPNSGCWESRSLVYLGFQGCHCACPGPEKRPRASVFLGRPSQPSPREQGWRSASRPPGGRGPAQERPLKQGSYFRDLYRLERGRAAGFSKLLPKGSIIIWVH